MMDTDELCKEARGLKGSLANPKIMYRIGCWNGKTCSLSKIYIGSVSWELVSAGGLGSAGSELPPERPSFTQVGKITVPQSEEAIMMTRYASECLESWTPVSDRIISARFDSRNIKTTIIHVCAPTNDGEDVEAKETLCDQ